MIPLLPKRMSNLLLMSILGSWHCFVSVEADKENYAHQPSQEAGYYSTEHSELPQGFIEDIISSWKLLIPTIVVSEEEIPYFCKNDMMLCLTNDDDTEGIAEHLLTLHRGRKQDGIIFVGSGKHRELLSLLADITPSEVIINTVDGPGSIFTSECPVFMPEEYRKDLKLRLDSNIVFFKPWEVKKCQLVDIFAVKDGLQISEVMGNWDGRKGITFSGHRNRWDRRRDLRGANFTNGFHYQEGWAIPVRDDEGNLVGSEGYFQEMLFYITDGLNVTLKSLQYSNPFDGNGTYGALSRKEIDVNSVGVEISWRGAVFYDNPMSVIRIGVTLIAARPNTTAPNMWVYVQVFEVTQWLLFLGSSIILVMALAIVSVANTERTVGLFDPEGGNEPEDSTLNQLLSGIGLIYLYFIQMGSHQGNTKQAATRLLSLTISLFTFMCFVYYNTDITSKMTSGTRRIPIRNFEDVNHHGCKVVTHKYSAAKDMLKYSEQGSAKHKSYEKMTLEDKTFSIEAAFKAVVDEEKTFYYTGETMLESRHAKKYKGRLLALKMEDISYSMASFALANNSEFLQPFNHYILKEYEHGIVKRLYKKWHPFAQTNHEFGIPEPIPLGYQIVLFPFIYLGFGACVSLILSVIEFLSKKCSRKRKSGTMPVAQNGNNIPDVTEANMGGITAPEKDISNEDKPKHEVSCRHGNPAFISRPI